MSEVQAGLVLQGPLTETSGTKLKLLEEITSKLGPEKLVELARQ